MNKFAILGGALAALFIAGCGDKDPVSSQPASADNPSQFPQKRWSYEGWTEGSYAEDYNGDGTVDQADFTLFLSQVSPDDTPPDSLAAGTVPSKLDPGFAEDHLQQPALYVAGNPDQAALFINWLNDPELMAQIWDNDYSTTWVVAAFRGQMPTSGYGIAIEDLQSDGQTVKLYARLSDPDPEQMLAQVISYPVDVRFVSKSQAPMPEGATWTLFTGEGKLLAQSSSGIVGPALESAPGEEAEGAVLK
jgi:hypothetical protein